MRTAPHPQRSGRSAFAERKPLPAGVQNAHRQAAAGPVRRGLFPQVQSAAARTGSATMASQPRTGSTSSATGSCGARSSAGPATTTWDEYDRQMELAAKHGIKTVIAELIHAVPDWAMRTFAHARQVRADGRPLTSNMGVSSATGGFSNNGGGAGALSLNCPEVKEAAGNFLKALASRYKGHPGTARLRRLERMQLFAGGRLRQLRQGGVPRLGAGEVRRPRDAEPRLEPLQLQRFGRHRAAGRDGALSGSASTGCSSSATITTARCSGGSTRSAASTRTV